MEIDTRNSGLYVSRWSLYMWVYISSSIPNSCLGKCTYILVNNALSPSGKAQDFDSCIVGSNPTRAVGQLGIAPLS